MKHLSLYFLLIPFYSVGQIQLHNSDLLDTAKHQLYLKEGNHVIVKSAKVFDEIRFTGQDPDHLKPTTITVFIVYPSQLGEASISIYRKGKMLHSSAFTIESLPDPVVRIGHSLDTFMTVRQIRATPFLNILYPHTNYKGTILIWGFTLTVEYQSGDISNLEPGLSGYLSSQQLNLINRLSPGDRMLFTNIRGGCADGRLVALPSFTVTVK